MSAYNCAHAYLLAHINRPGIPTGWAVTDALSHKHVNDAFKIISLWEDAIMRNSTLSLPHGGLQADRFTQALDERSDRIRLYGFAEIHHRCDQCVRAIPAVGETGMTILSFIQCIRHPF